MTEGGKDARGKSREERLKIQREIILKKRKLKRKKNQTLDFPGHYLKIQILLEELL